MTHLKTGLKIIKHFYKTQLKHFSKLFWSKFDKKLKFSLTIKFSPQEKNWHLHTSFKKYAIFSFSRTRSSFLIYKTARKRKTQFISFVSFDAPQSSSTIERRNAVEMQLRKREREKKLEQDHKTRRF